MTVTEKLERILRRNSSLPQLRLNIKIWRNWVQIEVLEEKPFGKWVTLITVIANTLEKAFDEVYQRLSIKKPKV